MTQFVDIAKLEIEILDLFFKEKGLSFKVDSWPELAIRERNYSGKGLLTEFEPSETLSLRCTDCDERWTNAVGVINGDIDIGFLVYVDAGRVTAVEVFTYGGENWPDSIRDFEIHHIEVTHIPPKGDD